MATLDFVKCPSNERVTVWIGPGATGVLGVTDVNEPLAAELNNVGGTSGMQNASVSISWNDYGFGIQASETQNEPSLADASTYEEFGRSNYGGTISFWMPQLYDDASNQHSVIYDLTDEPGVLNDIAVRIDGDVKTTVAATDGDFVSVFRVQGEGETNPFTPGESKRRTVQFIQKSDFSNQVVVGDHAITALDGPTLALTVAGGPVRTRASQQGRDVTNYLEISTANPAVAQVYPGGFVEPLSVGSSVVTFTDPGTGDTATVTVNVT